MMTFGTAVWEGGLRDGRGAISTKSGTRGRNSVAQCIIRSEHECDSGREYFSLACCNSDCWSDGQ
jgi:hypothetical protein